MERNPRFYKLNKRRRYTVEGTHFKVGEAIFLGVVVIFFFAAGIGFIVVNFRELSDMHNLAFIFGFFSIVILVAALGCVRYRPVFRQKKRARKILKSGTLTDGKVISVVKQQIRRYGGHRYYSYDDVLIKYEYATHGGVKTGEHRGSYAYCPFFVGQNLMVAFNGEDSVILSKFTLSDGAEEFAADEAERVKPDFSNLSGEIISIDISKPVTLASYDWSLFIKTSKRRKRLEKILKDPSFTVGRFYRSKATYRRDNGNGLFYCYLNASGHERVGECRGIDNFEDGKEVIVAYCGEISEVIGGYTIKKRRKRKTK